MDARDLNYDRFFVEGESDISAQKTIPPIIRPD